MADPRDQLQTAAAKLGIGSYQRHVFLCTGPSCCTSQVGQEAWEALKEALKEHNLGGICQRSKVGCLRICCHGPTLVVYPEGTWYHGMTAERIPRFVREHLIEGRPIGEWIFARNPLPDENTGGAPGKLAEAIQAEPPRLEQGIQISPNPLLLQDRERKREDGTRPVSEQLRSLVWCTIWAFWGALEGFLFEQDSSGREVILNAIMGGIIGAVGGWIGARFVGKRVGQSLVLFWTLYWAIARVLFRLGAAMFLLACALLLGMNVTGLDRLNEVGRTIGLVVIMETFIGACGGALGGLVHSLLQKSGGLEAPEDKRVT